MQNFRNIQVWQKSHQFCLKIYQATRGFPREEIYGLTSQIRRSAASIPTNIAEGCVRESDADFNRFINISIGSASEVDYQLLLARDLKYLNDAEYSDLAELVNEIRRMLIGFSKKLKQNT